MSFYGRFVTAVLLAGFVGIGFSSCNRHMNARAASYPVGNVQVYDYTDKLSNCITAFGFIPLIDTKNVDGICKGNNFKNFAILYDLDKKSPIVSMEKLFGTFGSVERKNDFHAEPSLHAYDKASLNDFKDVASIYDRGHLTPAGDIPLSSNIKESDEAMHDTFTLANMTPQVSEMNRGVWAKGVEIPTRKYVARVPNNKVFIYTGVSGEIGKLKNGTVIPKFMWKLVYDQTDNRAWAYWMENSKDVSFAKFPLITVAQLETNIKNNGNTILFRLPNDVKFIAQN